MVGKTSRKRKGDKSRDIVQEVIDRLADAMVADGKVAWQRPWTVSTLPTNGFTGEQYHGSNLFWLLFEQMLRGYKTAIWLTYNQAVEMGKKMNRPVYVRKGETATIILRPIFHKKMLKKDVDGEEQEVEVTWTSFSGYPVFNLDQIEGLTPEDFKVHQIDFVPMEEMDAVIGNMPNAPKQEWGFAAYYTPKTDTVTLPRPENFHSVVDFYLTQWHEYLHSTGHASRLNREGVANISRTGLEEYSFEELVVSLGVMLMAARTGLPYSEDSFKNDVAYVKAWASRLKENKNWLPRAAKLAEEAVNYILSGSGTQVSEETEEIA